MTTSAFTPNIYASCIDGEDVRCSKQHGKTYSTIRKSFTLSTAKSRPEIMQQVLGKNCQSVQECHKKIQHRVAYSLTRGMNDQRFSQLQIHPKKIKHVPHTTSFSNNNTTPQSFSLYNSKKVRYFPSRTKNGIQKRIQEEIKVPNKFNMHVSSNKNDIEMESNVNFTGSNSMPELQEAVTKKENNLQNRRNTSNKKASSTLGFRIKRLRTSPATEAAATTTAWVNTLIIGWLVVQELFLVCPPCDARSTTAINAGNPDAKRLYDDLLSNYNKLVRPVVNTTDALQVMIKLKLSQLIDVVSK